MGDIEECLFDLPPRMTSFQESESFLLAQPGCSNFSLHLQRLLGPLAEELRNKLATEKGEPEKIVGNNGKQEQAETCGREEELKQLSTRIRRLCQESVIAFPKSPGGISRSPRYQESIRIAVENAVLWMLQPVLLPLLRKWFNARDKALHQKINRLWRRGHSVTLREDLAAIPLPAALVELAAIDQHSTPLDKVTCVHNCLEQVDTHTRTACLEAGTIPPELEASLAILVQAVKMVETMVERRSHSARRREVSLEQLIGLTEELENRYGRHGEPETDRPRSTRDLEREKLAVRLELSSREVTEHEEAEWRSLDSSNPTQGWPPPRQGNLLRRFHSRILCSGDE